MSPTFILFFITLFLNIFYSFVHNSQNFWHINQVKPDCFIAVFRANDDILLFVSAHFDTFQHYSARQDLKFNIILFGVHFKYRIQTKKLNNFIEKINTIDHWQLAVGPKTSKKLIKKPVGMQYVLSMWRFELWNVGHWDVENVQKFNSSHYLLFRTGLLKTKSFPLMESSDNNNYKIWEIASGWDEMMWWPNWYQISQNKMNISC